MKKVAKRCGLISLILLMCLSFMMIFSACKDDEKKSLTLTFKVGEENYAAMPVDYNDFSLPEAPVKEGYTFEGWYWDDGEWEKPFTKETMRDMVTSGYVSVYAKFSMDVYTITYETNGGTHNNPNTYTVEQAVALTEAEKPGYNFAGWYLDENQVSEITKGQTGNITLRAKWDKATYSIIYTDTKGCENVNTASYQIDSDTIVLHSLDKEGFLFNGWFLGEERITEIPSGSYGDITLRADWIELQYKLTFAGVNDFVEQDFTEYHFDDDKVLLKDVQKDGYTFQGWYIDDQKVTGIPLHTTGNIIVRAEWEIIEYAISFTGVENAVNENVETYNIESGKIVLNDPIKEGYSFVGWFIDDVETNEVLAGSMGNVSFEARWELVTYFITYGNINGAEMESVYDTYNTESETELKVPTKTGFLFNGWTKDGVLVSKIERGTIGNIVLEARWISVHYKLIYKGVEDIIGQEYYTYIPDTDSLVLNTLTKEGHTFEGWYIGETKVTELPITTEGEVVLEARWSLTDYVIRYNGVEGAINNNVNSYKITTGNIIFNKPQKNGYKFVGWFDGENEITEIPSGSVGDVTIEARWTVIEYVITYSNTKNAENNNSTIYTVVSDTILLEDVYKDGYEFEGWFDGENRVTEVATGSFGNMVLEAKWSIIEYSIVFEAGADAIFDNITKYTVETGKIELNDAERKGYTFDGWYKDGDKITEIAAGSFGDIIIEAKFTIIEYTIIFGGIEGATHNNTVNIYTVESDKIVFEDAEKRGYNFEGWFNGNDKVTEIPVGSIGDIVLEARWTLIEYEITFDGVNGATNNNTTKYTVESDTIVFEDAEKKGYTFDGWYKDGDKITEIVAGSIGDIIIEAKFTIIRYNIIFDGVEGATNGNVTVYTVEDRIVLKDPSYEGRTFAGWFDGDRLITEIPSGSIGELHFTAKWVVNINGSVYKAGTDYDLGNSTSIENVVITISGNGIYKQTQSDGTGNYSFNGLPMGEYTLGFEKEGCIRVTITITVEVHTIKYIYMDVDQSSTINGTVLRADSDNNISNNTKISGATVCLTKQSGTNTLTFSTVSDSNGKYQFTGLTAGIYLISITKSGYIAAEQYILVEERAQIVQNMSLEIIAESSESVTGGASGMVYDASVQGNVGVSGLTLILREGINNIAKGEILGRYTTSTNGEYSITGLRPSNYTIVVKDERTLANEDSRYTDSYFNIKVLGNTVIDGQNGSVVAKINVDELKIVLEWGSSPSDLDSHLTGPTASGGRYHVYYSNKVSGNAELDRDDTDSYGPETITVTLDEEGVYRYSVHDYSNQSSSSSKGIANSNATVKVYSGSKLLYTFYAPDEVGTLWTVFEYDTETKTIVPINSMTNQSNSGNVS